jgi:hypothetical protein
MIRKSTTRLSENFMRKQQSEARWRLSLIPSRLFDPKAKAPALLHEAVDAAWAASVLILPNKP